MPFSEALKQKVRKRTKHRCCICNEPFIDVHHIIREDEDGPNTEDNAAPLCVRCHNIYGHDPFKRKQLKEIRDEWYKRCEELDKQFDSGVHQIIQTLQNKATNAQKEIEGISGNLSAGKQTETDLLRQKLSALGNSYTKLQAELMKTREQENQAFEQRITELHWNFWPEKEATETCELLEKATNNTYQGLMEWQERFVYYLLLKAGGKVDNHKFCELAFKEFTNTFPNPKEAAWETRVLKALGQLLLKGFIKGPYSFTPGAILEVVKPFPYTWRKTKGNINVITKPEG